MLIADRASGAMLFNVFAGLAVQALSEPRTRGRGHRRVGSGQEAASSGSSAVTRHFIPPALPNRNTNQASEKEDSQLTADEDSLDDSQSDWDEAQHAQNVVHLNLDLLGEMHNADNGASPSKRKSRRISSQVRFNVPVRAPRTPNLCPKGAPSSQWNLSTVWVGNISIVRRDDTAV